MRRSHAFIAATLLAGTAVLAGCSSQGSSAEPGRQAADGQTCDWTGTGGSILDASNMQGSSASRRTSSAGNPGYNSRSLSSTWGE